MSDMEAKHIRLVKADESKVAAYTNKTVGMDEFELSDYMCDAKLLLLNGKLWEYRLVEDLDPCGFTHVLKDEENTKELITLWYNGGACLDEIVEWAFKE